MDKLSPARRSENMRRIRSKDTLPELIVRSLVFGLGFRYRLHDTSLPGRPDIVLRRLGKIIDVRGCFWHQHKRCVDGRQPKSATGYWKPKLASNVARDRKNLQKLTRAGWRVLRIWDCETKDLTSLRQKILGFLTAPD